jgi:uncharacterized protein YndB with AHSA1/START domain
MELTLRALAETHRRQILALVRDRELLAGSISEHFGITRPAVSQHLSVLKDAGLLAERREGTRRWYRARPEGLAGVRVFIDDLWNEHLTELKRVAEGDVERLDGNLTEIVSVEREVTIGVAPEALWELLVNPEKMTRWMGQRASVDLRVGGHYEVEVLPGLFAAGEFLEVDPPRRLVHTWGWRLDDSLVPPGSTVVVYELLERGDHTRLRLSHRGLPSIRTAGSHSRGWAHYLPRLAAVASGAVPDPDPWADDPVRMEGELRPASGGSPTRKGKNPR